MSQIFSAESFVLRRNSTNEISSMLSSLYVTSDRDETDDDDDDDETRSVVEVLSQTEMVQMKAEVGNVKGQIQVLETKLTDAINSSLNRETSLRKMINISLSKLEEHFYQGLERLEREMVNCLLRQDEKWERKLLKVKFCITPTSPRLLTSRTTAPQIHVEPVSNVSQTNTHCMTGLAGASSFCANPPIRLEFPEFGISMEIADVLHLIEQCESYMEVRPLSWPELLGTLSTVLKSPASSWWRAAKCTVHDWKSFKEAFMAAFLPADYMSEVEEKLRVMVQQPGQKLRDFAYDYRALCIKWKPELSEEEMVNKILNNVNPKIAGSLRGTVHSVEQLVKIGSMVEKDCMSIKDYWQKVNDQAGKDKINKRGSNKPVAPSVSAGLSVIQHHHHWNQINPASLLVVPIILNGWQVEAVVDTRSAFTLMQESRWKEIAGMYNEIQNVKQNFVMADGKMHQSKGQVEMKHDWHQERGKVDVYAMEDSHLVFPVVLGLDFLTRVGSTFDFSQLCYKLPSKRGESGYPFICSQQPSFIQGAGNQMISSRPRSNLSLYYPITEEQ